MIPRMLFEILSPGGKRARLTVFIFHRVRPEVDPLFPGDPDARAFELQMRWVAAWFNVVPVPAAVAGLRDGTLPSRAAAITFDDGYADNCTIALPILARLRLNATFFVATGYLDGGRMWNDTIIEGIRHAATPEVDVTSIGLGRLKIDSVEAKRRAIHLLLPRLKYLAPQEREVSASNLADSVQAILPTDLMLTSRQVGELSAAGMTIGAHTVTHPILANLDEAAARNEICESKARLQSITGKEIDLFAYPNGKPGKDYHAVHSRLVREAGFRSAFSTTSGVACAQSDPYQLPRFTPWDKSAPRYAIRLMQNLRRPMLGAPDPAP